MKGHPTKKEKGRPRYSKKNNDGDTTKTPTKKVHYKEGNTRTTSSPREKRPAHTWGKYCIRLGSALGREEKETFFQMFIEREGATEKTGARRRKGLPFLREG